MEAERVGVAVVGSINLDVTIRLPRLPERGETVVGHDLATAPGGKGANQAVAAARQGVRTALVGCVGDDTAGDDVLAFLARDALLDTRGVGRLPSTATGAALVTVADDGGNTVAAAFGANARLTDEHVHRNGRAIGDASVLLVQLGIPVDAARAALEIARGVGTTSILDPAPADLVPDDFLRMADVITPNETEAAYLSGMSVVDLESAARAAERLLARGCGAVVVTLAERGAVYLSRAGMRRVEPFAVEAVDPTGAGDAFAGALAAALSRGEPMEVALEWAAAAGALAAAAPGAAPSMPTARAVAELLARTGRAQT